MTQFIEILLVALCLDPDNEEKTDKLLVAAVSPGPGFSPFYAR